MPKRIVRRHIAVLLLLPVLALAGARPAAAAPDRFEVWARHAWTLLESLWQAATGDRGAGLDPNGGGTNAPAEPGIGPDPGAGTTGDRGAGLDPNGGGSN